LNVNDGRTGGGGVAPGGFPDQAPFWQTFVDPVKNHKGTGGGSGGGAGYGGGGAGYGSQGGSQGENRSRQDALQPCTVKQVLEAAGPDDNLTINNVSLQQVTVVALLSNVETQVTMMTMTLDDGSGKINCVHMLPPDESANDAASFRRNSLRDGTWVRLVGRIVVASGNRQLEAYMLRAVGDHNELIYHRLDVTRTMLAQTRGKKAANINNNGNGNFVSTTPGGMTGVTSGIDGLALEPTLRAVFDYAKQRHEDTKNIPGNMNEPSFTVEDIMRDVPGCKSHKDTREALDRLASDGHVYSTTDDDHYAFCQV